jgi:hypothetical protein
VPANRAHKKIPDVFAKFRYQPKEEVPPRRSRGLGGSSSAKSLCTVKSSTYKLQRQLPRPLSSAHSGPHTQYQRPRCWRMLPLVTGAVTLGALESTSSSPHRRCQWNGACRDPLGLFARPIAALLRRITSSPSGLSTSMGYIPLIVPNRSSCPFLCLDRSVDDQLRRWMYM